MTQIFVIKKFVKISIIYQQWIGPSGKGLKPFKHVVMDSILNLRLCKKSCAFRCIFYWYKILFLLIKKIINNCWAQILGIDFKLQHILIKCDNTSAIDLTKTRVLHSRTKFIEIHHHFLSDSVEKGNVVFKHMAPKVGLLTFLQDRLLQIEVVGTCGFESKN